MRNSPVRHTVQKQGFPGFVSLNQYQAEKLGVSRQHILLRPTKTKLYIIEWAKPLVADHVRTNTGLAVIGYPAS